MAAHWQLGRLSLGALKLGPRAWLPMTRLFGRMLRLMGLPWVGGYLASLWNGIGARGVAAADGWCARSRRATPRRWARSSSTTRRSSSSARRSLLPSTLSSAPCRPGSRLEIDGAGHRRLDHVVPLPHRRPRADEGLALLEFAPDVRRIRRARFFPA